MSQTMKLKNRERMIKIHILNFFICKLIFQSCSLCLHISCKSIFYSLEQNNSVKNENCQMWNFYFYFISYCFNRLFIKIKHFMGKNSWKDEAWTTLEAAACMPSIYINHETNRPSLELKIWPQSLLGSLLLDIALKKLYLHYGKIFVLPI